MGFSTPSLPSAGFICCQSSHRQHVLCVMKLLPSTRDVQSETPVLIYDAGGRLRVFPELSDYIVKSYGAALTEPWFNYLLLHINLFTGEDEYLFSWVSCFLNSEGEECWNLLLSNQLSLARKKVVSSFVTLKTRINSHLRKRVLSVQTTLMAGSALVAYENNWQYNITLFYISLLIE